MKWKFWISFNLLAGTLNLLIGLGIGQNPILKNLNIIIAIICYATVIWTILMRNKCIKLEKIEKDAEILAKKLGRINIDMDTAIENDDESSIEKLTSKYSEYEKECERLERECKNT